MVAGAAGATNCAEVTGVVGCAQEDTYLGIVVTSLVGGALVIGIVLVGVVVVGHDGELWSCLNRLRSIDGGFELRKASSKWKKRNVWRWLAGEGGAE